MSEPIGNQELIAQLRQRANTERVDDLDPGFEPEVTWLEMREISELLARAADALSAISVRPSPTEEPRWLPIETAPSGTMVLLCSMEATEARSWCYVDWLVQGKLCGVPSRPKPTHWMPLPAAPSIPQKESR